MIPSPDLPAPLELRLADRLRSLGADDGSPLLVAFSGGTDSLALLAATLRAAASRPLDVHACHVDHGLDPDSADRARRARRLAADLGLAAERFHPVDLDARPAPGESVEAWAREHRYAALGRVAGALGGAWVVTAHHADDQAETVILRLLFGSGLRGLRGIHERRGRLIRPLLGIPRIELARFVAATGLTAVQDPTNEDWKVPRNRIRRGFLHEKKREEPGMVELLSRVAEAARRTTDRLDRILGDMLEARPLEDLHGARLSRPALERLPREARIHALGLLDELADREHPSSTRSRGELLRQIDAGVGPLACDSGAGWRWHGDGRTVRLLGPSAQPSADFTYTLRAPGSIELSEIGARVTVTRGRPEAWMLESHADKVGLSPPDGEASELHLEIRNRRPGDRIQPFGSRRPKKLKDLLIDRRIPRERRDRLPIVVLADRPAWVPGVTLDERCRLRPDAESVWIIELRGSEASSLEYSRPARDERER